MNKKWDRVVVPVTVIMVNGVMCYRAEEAARHLAIRMWSNVRNQYSAKWDLNTLGTREARSIARARRRLNSYFRNLMDA